MSKSSNVDIVLFFWPDIDSFTDIKRGNSSSLFLRVLLEVCSTVCIKVSQSELDNFYVDKQTVQDKMEEEEQSMGGGIQVGMKEEQKNDVSCNVEKMQSFLIEKERKQGSSNVSVASKYAFVIEGAQSTILCHCSIQEHVIEPKPLQFTFSSKEELMNYIKQTAQTYRLKLWDEAFDTWGKALIFAESICPELIEEFDRQSRLIDKEHKTQISTAQSTAQELWNSEMLGLEFEYGEIFAYKCKDRNLAEMREMAKGLSNEKTNNFFSVGCNNSSASPSKKDFDNGIVALTKFIPNNPSYHAFSNNTFRELDSDVKKLYKWYEDDLSKVEESVRKQFEQEKREAEERKEKEKEKNKNKDNNENNNNDKNTDKDKDNKKKEGTKEGEENKDKNKEETKEEENKDKDKDKDKENEKNKEKKEVEQREEATKEKQEKIKNENNNPKSDDERGQTKNENKNNQQSIGDKTTPKDSRTESGSWWIPKIEIPKKIISWLSGNTQLTEEDKQVIKDRLACYDYTQLQIRCIAGLGKIYEKYKQIFINNNKIKPVSFREGDLKKEYSNNRSKRESELNKTFLKKLNERMNNGNSLSCDINNSPKKNEFDIRGNEELVFAYGLANNEMVLVLSIDRNVSDALTVEEKYSDDDKNAGKQDVWSKQYNQNCITKIFLSSKQVLNKQKAKEELRGKITLAALSEQKHSMVLYERAKQLIHVYKWNERITDSLQQLKNKTIDLSQRVSSDDFYVASMCFDNKDDNLYILDNKIQSIALYWILQYSKVMVTLEGGYIVGIKPQEQEEEKEQEQVPTVQAQMQSDHNNDVVTEGNVQTSSETLGETPGETSGETSGKNNEPGSMKVDMKEKETQPLGSESNTTITTVNTVIIPPVKRVPTGLVECDFYVLDDSKELVRSLVLPKEFMSNGISDIRFKLILQKQAYIVSLDNQFILHCLPLQVSLKKSQLHVELTSMYGDLTNNEGATQIKPSKLDYIEYSLDKFGSKPEFYSQSKLTLHLSVLLNANESKSLSWVSKEKLTQASELVLHACDKVNRDTKKIFTYLDWQCLPIAIDATKKQIYLKD
ncbi:hypothetical protein RFI_36378, partial [Reticulomyxa filosa]